MFDKPRTEREIGDEIASNLQFHVEDGLRDGMSPREARRHALIRLGGIEPTKEAWRDRRGIPVLESLWKDVVYAFRTMGRSKGWTAVAILSLALGIGANTALFSFVYRMLIEELPVRAPRELVAFRWTGPNNVARGVSEYGSLVAPEGERMGASFPVSVFAAFQEANRTLTDVFAAVPGRSVNLIANEEPDVASPHYVSGNYYRGLGVSFSDGRSLLPDDDRPGADAAIVITHSYWTERFGMDDAVVGKTVSVNGVPATIIGVEPPGLENIMGFGGGSVDLKIPLAMESRFESNIAAEQWRMLIMGRLSSDTTADQVQANLGLGFQDTARANDEAYRASRTPEDLERLDSPQIPRLIVAPGGRGIYDVPVQVQPLVALLVGVFGIVLLIVCVNVANLLLSRAENRQSEMAVRMAIGAGRGRLIRQMLTESVVLASLGGTAGLGIAIIVPRLFETEVTPPGALDLRALGFAGGVSVVTGLLFGMAPASRAGRDDVGRRVYAAGNRAGRSRSWLGKSLVVAQISLSLILLVGASLFLTTLVNLRSVDTGFDSEDLVLFTLDPRHGEYESGQAIRAFDRILGNLEAVPDIRGATYSNHALLSGITYGNIIAVEGSGASRVSPMTVHRSFFETIGIDLMLGRDFTDADSEESPRVAVINETAARRIFGEENPLGHRIGRGNPPDYSIEIVGVVADTKYNDFRNEPPLMVFYPQAQEIGAGPRTFAVRTLGNTETVVPQIREAVRRVDPDLPVLNVMTQREAEARLLIAERVFASVTTIFGGLALVVAAIGLFGLMSYAVSRRTREIGIRVALGAHKNQVLSAALRDSLTLVGIGVVLGVGGSLAATRLIGSMLFGLEPNDPATILAAVAVMLMVSAVAAYLPARRASRVNPIIALRHE